MLHSAHFQYTTCSVNKLQSVSAIDTLKETLNHPYSILSSGLSVFKHCYAFFQAQNER